MFHNIMRLTPSNLTVGFARDVFITPIEDYFAVQPGQHNIPVVELELEGANYINYAVHPANHLFAII